MPVPLYATWKDRPNCGYFKRAMKLTFKILTLHIAIGALITFIVFWAMGELPYFSDISDRMWIWILTPIIILLVIWLSTNTVFHYVTNKMMNNYVLSAIFIFIMCMSLFLSTTLLEGINASAKSGKNEIFNFFEGFVVYRLWVYLVLGIMHALIGGIFLTMDLRKLSKGNLSLTK